MKLSAFLALSVPLAMFQLPALADTTDMADTANWLKSSIATLKSPAKSQTTKVSHAMPTEQASGVKIRPFVPNRYLPHERDLIRNLQAQQAQSDPTAYMNAPQTGRLSGEVASSYSAPYMVPGPDRYAGAMLSNPSSEEPRAAKFARNTSRSRVPRIMPGQVPVLPDQLTSKTSSIPPVIPDPPSNGQMYPSNGRPEFPVTMPMSSVPPSNYGMPSQPYAASDPPSISAQEQMLLERLMAQNKPTAIMGNDGEIYGQTLDNPDSGTGPAPFPNSLLTGNAAPRFGAGPMRKPIPQARFGSWHQQAAALPESGFHSYIPYRQPRLYAIAVAPQPHDHRLASRRTGKQAVGSGPPHRTIAANPTHTRAAEPQKVALATYPTYVSRSGLSY